MTILLEFIALSFLFSVFVPCGVQHAVTYVASSTSFCTLDVHKRCDSMLLQAHRSAPCMCIRALCRSV